MDDIWIISWFNHTAFDANPNLEISCMNTCLFKSKIDKHMFFLAVFLGDFQMGLASNAM